MEQVANIHTPGDIARAEGVALHVLNHALRTYKIEAKGRAGIVRIFDESQLPEIRAALKRCASRRPGFRDSI